MEIIISSNTSKPIYEQITSQIKAMIMSGELKTGDSIPSMRALAKSIHVSVITVQKAYEDLQRDGFIETTVGRGSFVSAQNKDFYQEEQQRLAEEHLQEAADIGRISGISLEKLTKQYADFKLDHVSFSVPKGTIMGLIGENGAGKSTTINAILDLIHKDDGTVTFWGQELSSTKQIKEDVGVVFDGINFYETLTPAKVGKIAGAAYKQWDGHLFQDYLKRFQLPADKEIKSLSKGMKMKLCIAVALSHNPKLLILDEATSGLDPVMRDDILDVFLEFVQDENHSILMSSHITTDLEKVADYITFIHQGKVLFCKTKDELRYNYGIIRCGAALFDQLDKAEILAYRKDDYQWNVLVADKEKARRKYKNAVVDDATIDDILLLYVKGEQAK